MRGGQSYRMDKAADERLKPWAGLPRFSCGNCGAVFATKGDKGRHKQTCCKSPRHGAQPVTSDDFIGDEDLYADMRPHNTPAKRAEAARQWNEIPDTPAEIAVWMKGEPL